MTKLIYLLLFLLFYTSISAQKVNINSDAVNTCSGAINIFENGDYLIQFTGKKSESSIDGYPSLSQVERDNQLWFSFVAPTFGELSFKGSKEKDFLQMVVFAEEKNDVCGEISATTAEIKRLHLGKGDTLVGLDYSIGGGVLYVIKLKKGEKINILFSTSEKQRDLLSLNWNFIPKKTNIEESKIVDRRNDDFAPTFKITVRDSATNKSLVANLSIEGSREIDGLYMGSDFLFNITRNTKLKLKCDMEGYIFDDRLVEVSAFDNQEITFLLDKIASGKTIKIEEIEFKQGTSEIVESSESKLRRLKDFLALNSEIKIEIQGHVFALGDNSFAGQKMSEARAKRIMKYLIENGIDRDRLSSVGYGNTRPIFAEPKFFYEEQANRRVEILVK